MQPREIQVSRFYLKRDETDVRQVLGMSGGQIFWQGYDYRTGKPLTNFSCSLEYFAQWAGRELTEEEQGRMQSDAALETLRNREEKLIEMALMTATLDQLRTEIARREALIQPSEM